MTDPNPRPGAPAPSSPPPSFAPPSPPAAVPPPPPSPAHARPPRSGGYSKWVVLVLAPVLAVVMFAGGVGASRSGLFGETGGQAGPAASPAANLDLVEEAWRTIHENYVDAQNLDDEELAHGAIRGLTDAVGDEGHTSFLTAEEAKAMDDSLSGTFVGIGVQVDGDETDGPTIRSVIPATPAEEAGLRRGDRIVAVDGRSTAGETVDQVVSRVRGPEGEPVTLTIERGDADPFDVTIVRRQFDLPLVTWAMVPGGDVAMIRLDQFATGATKGIKEAVAAAREAGAKALVLDLRGNPGGYVNEAVGVASQFVGDGIVYKSINAGGKEEEHPVEKDGVATDIPLVVLADGDTASSGEIVTGAIQDAARGRVVGEKTFGTGTVLGRFDLSDGSSLRIGVERWLTRAGRPIWHEGLEPDVKVELPDDVSLLLPDDLRDLTLAQFRASADQQLLQALEELGAADKAGAGG